MRLALKMSTVFLCKIPFSAISNHYYRISAYSLSGEKGHLHQTIQARIQIVPKLKGICIHLLLWGNGPIFWPHGAMRIVQRIVFWDCNMHCINHLTNFNSILIPHPNANPHSTFPFPFRPFLFHFDYLSFSAPPQPSSPPPFCWEEQEIPTMEERGFYLVRLWGFTSSREEHEVSVQAGLRAAFKDLYVYSKDGRSIKADGWMWAL